MLFTVASHFQREETFWLRRPAWTTMVIPPAWAAAHGRNLELFMPTRAIVFGHKHNKITDAHYTAVYRELLRTTIAATDEWMAAQDPQKVVYLLCACADGAFCHRHLLAKFLAWRGGVQVPLPALRLAIIGSREYPCLPAVARYVQHQAKSTVIVNGGARGVDSAATAAAKQRGMRVEELRPDYAAYPPEQRRRAPLDRNTDIINAVEHVTAFWDGQSRGTIDALRKAHDRGISYTVYGPDGTLLHPKPRAA